MKKATITFLFICIVCNTALSSVSHTKQDGYWNDTATWEGGLLPDLSDSIFVKHYVIFEEDIFLSPPAVLTVTSTGTLCGHHLVWYACGSYLYCSGTLQADSLIATDGISYGYIHILYYTYVAPCRIGWIGGVNGGGEPFSCSFPLGISEEEMINNYQIFPNPFTSEININGKIPSRIKLINVNGETVAEATSTNQLYVGALANGIYVLQLYDKQGELLKIEKLIKQ